MRRVGEASPSAPSTFEALQFHFKGYEDDELRQFLVRAGAVRFLFDKAC